MSLIEYQGVNIAAPLKPFTSEDKFPLLDDTFLGGGFRAYETIAERDAIPLERRKKGMYVAVSNVKKIFSLENGIENSNWKEVRFVGRATKPLQEKKEEFNYVDTNIFILEYDPSLMMHVYIISGLFFTIADYTLVGDVLTINDPLNDGDTVIVRYLIGNFGIDDAPADGEVYARQDEEWVMTTRFRFANGFLQVLFMNNWINIAEPATFFTDSDNFIDWEFDGRTLYFMYEEPTQVPFWIIQIEDFGENHGNILFVTKDAIHNPFELVGDELYYNKGVLLKYN